jgi:hypothetical protein
LTIVIIASDNTNDLNLLITIGISPNKYALEIFIIWTVYSVNNFFDIKLNNRPHTSFARTSQPANPSGTSVRNVFGAGDIQSAPTQLVGRDTLQSVLDCVRFGMKKDTVIILGVLRLKRVRLSLIETIAYQIVF